MISGGYRCPLYDDDAAVTTTDLGSDQATHQLDSATCTRTLTPFAIYCTAVGAASLVWLTVQ